MSDETVEKLSEELAAVRSELREARERIAAMEASRFWKLRNAWWRVKTRFTGRPEVGASVPNDGPGRARSTPRPSDPHVSIVLRFTPGCPAPEPLLDALLTHTRMPYDVTIVDDGTAGDLAARLARISTSQRAHLVRHETLEGWARCANDALATARAPYVALLSADARPGPRWLERFVAALDGGDRVAAALPLGVELPAGIDAEGFGALLASDPPIRPTLLSLSPAPGILLRREVPAFDSSLSDTAVALAAFGEALRSGGLEAVLADDVWLGGAAMGASDDRVLASLLRRALRLPGIAARRREMRERFEGRRVLFVLPVMERGGGANVVFSEALELVRMGVDARVLNLEHFRASFERHYPVNEVPVLWAQPHGIPAAARLFDAVVATANTSVEWLTPLAGGARPPVLGYYVQDFEPYFYPEGSSGHRHARESYTLIPGMRLFTKTEWNRRELERRTGVASAVVGPSYDAATFRPRAPEPPDVPLRLAAMVRPSSARRQPGLTMDILEQLHARFAEKVSITTFGEDKKHRDWPPLERSFPHESVGVADSTRLAEIYSSIHAFLDFSTYQAMGLSALEAMACGATAILPQAGGAASFATDGEDALLVETSDAASCRRAVERLIEDATLRRRLGARAPHAAERFHPALAAANVLLALFADA